MLPGDDGLELLKKLKSSQKTKSIPVIMVTAKGTEYDKVIGLDSGADDYVTKPFGMMELVSRIKAVLRRSGKVEDRMDMDISGVHVNVKKHEVTVEGKEISLTLKEFELLEKLMRNQGIVLTRDQLLTEIWGYDFDGGDPYRGCAYQDTAAETGRKGRNHPDCPRRRIPCRGEMHEKTNTEEHDADPCCNTFAFLCHYVCYFI